MTNELALAIANYVKRPTFIRLEIGMALIRDGHLTRVEERRLRNTLDERERIRREQRANA